MNGENKVLNFICALIPGVGFMYNGLYKKGISFIILWFFLINIDNFLGLHFFMSIISISVWFYCFFKTFDVNKKIKRGEYVEDRYLFAKEGEDLDIGGKRATYIGILLVVIGVLAFIKNIFEDFFRRSRHSILYKTIYIAIYIYLNRCSYIN